MKARRPDAPPQFLDAVLKADDQYTAAQEHILARQRAAGYKREKLCVTKGGFPGCASAHQPGMKLAAKDNAKKPFARWRPFKLFVFAGIQFTERREEGAVLRALLDPLIVGSLIGG